MKFFDCHLYGKNYESDYQLISESKRLGYAGVSLFYSTDNYQSVDYLNDIQKELTGESDLADGEIQNNDLNPDFQIVPGVEIDPKNGEDLRKKINNFRKKSDLLMIKGGDLKINRSSCENSKVDILSRPYYRRRDCGINHVLAKEAAKNSVAIELNISDILRSQNALRSKLLGHFREIVKLQKKFSFPVLLTSGAVTNYDLRRPRDLVALSKCFGMDHEDAISALSQIPWLILEFNQQRNYMVVGGVKKINECK
jgi:ribonuclease P/MRP protein subunit RPP1